MSHEIRTPLNAIIGYLKIIEGCLGQPARVREYLGKQEYAAQHLLSIINDILDISSIESGKMKLASEPFDLKSLLLETAEIFRSQAKDKGIQFQMIFEELNQTIVIGDSLRVNQILMNLLSNAVKFTRSNGQVELRVTQKGIVAQRIHLQFSVKDTGIGMSKEYMGRIFTPFEQQEAGTAKHFGGSGLGLSITRNLVTMMNGTIDVESKEGEGSCFTVCLSLALAEDMESEGVQAALAKSNPALSRAERFKESRILLVEDNEMNREISETVLEVAGFHVSLAVNGAEALEKFQASPPLYYQLILMDIQMPIMDGYEATRRIRNCAHPEAKTIPIIACSADAFTEDVAHALAVGMNDHIAKPIEIERLYSLLEKYVS